MSITEREIWSVVFQALVREEKNYLVQPGLKVPGVGDGSARVHSHEGTQSRANSLYKRRHLFNGLDGLKKGCRPVIFFTLLRSTADDCQEANVLPKAAQMALHRRHDDSVCGIVLPEPQIHE